MTKKHDRQLRLKKLLERQLDTTDLDQVGGGKHDGVRHILSRMDSRYCTY